MRSKWFTKYKLAHRGLHNDKLPENSLGAFDNAIKHGFAIELDVRLTRDNIAVVIHDPNTKRMCDIDKPIDSIFAQDLKEYKLKNSKYSIPTLQEVLDLVDGRTPIMIELKPVKKKGRKLEEEVYKLIKDYDGDIAVKSFNPFSMMWFKKNAPEILRGMLASYFENTYMPKFYKFMLKRLAFYNKIKPDFISYEYKYIPNKFLKNKKIPIVAWTINSSELEKEVMKKASTVVFEGYIPDSPTNYSKKK